ncbi:hypothetical protein NEOLEDRAFT_1057283 [Neolentinus lepideus HHB14362 ss-1]|uniref:Glycosyltransferase 61 catalytic domain-containing protein n=1 Tax=Neolentinus lepideus HHB14362 ss-1 TaxID=1314782 RepID=A0A165V2C9_9AGAM|nr:hypothetical protein NEOLEDRAFT_1057283 [Neolentinus lepideus HHB14362 ss-1]
MPGILRVRAPTRLSGRDAFLILLGAFSMHLLSLLTGGFNDGSKNEIVVSTSFNSTWQLQDKNPRFDQQAPERIIDSSPPTKHDSHSSPLIKHDFHFSPTAPEQKPFDISTASLLPGTTLAHHAPGWTIFHNAYMSNGTIFVVSDEDTSEFPDPIYITSTGLPAVNSEENIRARLPTKYDLDFISTAEAQKRWSKREGEAENRVWTVEGSTVLFNDPQQFLDHYYHFVAELLFGTWAFWSGAQSQHEAPHSSAKDTLHNLFLGSSQSLPSSSQSPPPVPVFDRAIFAHARPAEWRDKPGFNGYFLRAAFPSLAVETAEDWQDRVRNTQPLSGELGRAYHFPALMLVDRSAAFKGPVCGGTNQRTAAEAYYYMRARGLLRQSGLEYDWAEGTPRPAALSYPAALGTAWWEDVRRRVVKFAGAGREEGLLSAEKGDVVITYISRQAVRRRLVQEQHEGLVAALQELVERKNREGGVRWEVNVVQAEKIGRDEQVRMASRSTVILGVHGNGLSHLILMPPSERSTVIEIFYPQGFAHDYEWTARALGHRHFAVWNDTWVVHTWPNQPHVNYPEGFQGTEIPVHGPYVAKLIEDRIEGRIP